MNTSPFGLPYWLDLERPVYPRLDQSTTADIAIVGAGIAGLKLARFLSRHGLDIVILEGGQVGDGASGRNQGSLNHAPGIGYAECIARYSRPIARKLWQLGLLNHELMREQLSDYAIDCDYDVGGFHSLARRDIVGHEQAILQYREDYQLLREDGFEVEWLDEPTARERGGSSLYIGGINYLTDAQFHSGKYVIGLARGVSQHPRVRLFEQTRVERITSEKSNACLETRQGRVQARHVFLATNALAPQFVPALEPGLRAERGQVLVTEPLAQRPCHGSFGTAMAWWREIVEPDGRWRLLFGGGRTRESSDSLFRQFDQAGQPHPKLEREGFSPSPEHQQRLDHEFHTLFPTLAGVRITHRWGGLQSFTADSLPMVGEFDPERQIHGMAGFSGRGNCYADVGADYLAGKVAGVPSQTERQFASLMTELLAVGRSTADWGPWTSAND